MNSSLKSRHRISVVLAFAFLALWAAAPALAEPLKIGVMAPVTGPWASEGQDMVKVVEILAAQVNSAGGVGGEPVVVVVADDGGQPKTAGLAAQKLVSSGVTAVVGTYGSSVTEASQSIYDEAKVLQIATGSTSIRLTEAGYPLFFRTCPRDDEQGRVLASQVKALGFVKVAIVHDNTSYAKGLADEARAIFRDDAGVTEVFFDAITPGDRDFTASLTKIKAAEPDVVVFTGYYPEAALLLRQKRDMNWEVPMIGGDATNNIALVEIAGREAAVGYYFISPPALADMTSPAAATLRDEFLAAHGSLPSSVWSVLAGDAFNLLVDAGEAVGPDSVKMAEWLKTGLAGYEGLSGPIAFDAIGDRAGEVYRLYRVDENGDFRLQ
jgi:branched-chain amino acid transport system substrate-binding protein